MLFEIIRNNLIGYDLIIIAILAFNIGYFFVCVYRYTEKLYSHFNRTDTISGLSEEVHKNIKKNTKKDKILGENELLDTRKKMNNSYALFSNLTTIFPLLGMLGTVISLIPMVNDLWDIATTSFFTALTSTFWGIIAAIICKVLDSRVSYKIEHNEICTNYLLNPNRQ